MPYVSTEDREIIDEAVELAAKYAAAKITNNLSVVKVYTDVFTTVAGELGRLLSGETGENGVGGYPEAELALAIFNVAKKYGYEGAHLGELNYAITRFIQRVPQIKVELGEWKEEFRYWLYAVTVEGLMEAYSYMPSRGTGIAGVFLDVKDEYKRRVNPAYEAAQILNSGDCYDTPYYNRLVEVVGEDGKQIGHILVDMKCSPETLHKNVLDGHLVFVRKKPK